MNYEMAREWTSSAGLGGHPVNQCLCASARVSPEFGLLCAQVGWRIHSRKHLIAGWRRMELIIAAAFSKR
jgi:hypothetical protein